jgi:hypothetical protein
MSNPPAAKIFSSLAKRRAARVRVGAATAEVERGRTGVVVVALMMVTLSATPARQADGNPGGRGVRWQHDRH